MATRIGPFAAGEALDALGAYKGLEAVVEPVIGAGDRGEKTRGVGETGVVVRRSVQTSDGRGLSVAHEK
ncbi:MAG: hypothetical protein JO319_00545 [Acidobacteriaceae bacterium]|nr:hypothetical protein [Acidobacteriaceae bacterium]